MFGGQVHERQQFKMTIQGDEYTGIFHGGDVHWFNPSPRSKLEEKHISSVESKVHDLLKNHIKD